MLILENNFHEKSAFALFTKFVALKKRRSMVYGQMESIQAVFISTYISQNVATLMPNLTSQSCGDSLPAVCLAGQVEPLTDHTNNRGRQISP